MTSDKPRCIKCRRNPGNLRICDQRFCRACRNDIAAIARERNGIRREIRSVVL